MAKTNSFTLISQPRQICPDKDLTIKYLEAKVRRLEHTNIALTSKVQEILLLQELNKPAVVRIKSTEHKEDAKR